MNSIADEIIIVDSSDHSEYIKYNRLILEKIKDKDRIKYFFEKLNITEGRRKVKRESSKEIIVHWDADMIAMQNGHGSMEKITSFAKSVKTKKVVYFPLLTPYHDLSNVTKSPIDIEGWIFSNTKKEL